MVSVPLIVSQEHGITNIAVLEKGWLGGGNTGATPPSSTLELSHMKRAWICTSIPSNCGKGLSQDLNTTSHVFGARRDDGNANVHDQQSFKRHNQCQPLIWHRQ